VVRVLWWQVHTKRLPILLLYLLGACRPSSGEEYSQKSSQNESVGAGVLLVSQILSAEFTFSLAQAFNFLAYVASQKERDGFCKTASCLCRVPLDCHGPLSSEEV